MVKVNCCVPGCTNNWRNSPNMKYHSLPSDPQVKKMYEKLIRNKTLKIDSKSTKICGAHFPEGERMCRTQLPSIFPWTSAKKEQRKIERIEVPLIKTSKTLQTNQHEASNEASGHFIEVDAGSVSHVIDDGRKEQGTQTNQEEEVQALKDEIASLKKKIQSLEDDIRLIKTKPKFDIDDHKSNDEDISFYTGFPNYDTLELCFDMIKEKSSNLDYSNDREDIYFHPDYKKPGSKRKLTVWQEFTLVLLRLRLGLFEKDLAERFRVSISTVSLICRTWIKFMRKELEPICIQWPSREQIIHYMPPVFKSFYTNLVSIIDCTEMQMESPSSLDKKSLCYSSYKSRTTMKALLGITPNGVVSFCSDLYCGSISDPDIVNQSGFLTHLNRGDLVMADKGFTIQDQLATVGARLALPHFLKGKKQFTKEESEHNKKIASLRIHVERYMERIKNWHFFDRPVPISMSDIASDTWIVISCFTNFLPPIVT